MIQFSYTIRDELGIHARPAGQLAKVVKSFEPTVISITKEGKTVKASQLMKLMGLAIKKGTRSPSRWKGSGRKRLPLP